MVYLLLLTALLGTDSQGEGLSQAAAGWVENARQEGWDIDPLDSLVFVRTMDDFCTYLEENFGSRKLERIRSDIHYPYQLSDVLEERTGERFGEHYFEFYTFFEKKSPHTGIWEEAESEHFRFVYQSRSAASRDLDIIQAVAESSFARITGILSPSSSSASRLSRLVYADSAGPTYTRGKIVLKLYPERSDLGSFERTSGGQTSYRPVWFKDSVGYALWIELAYPGPVGVFGIPHEVAHALALTYLADEERLTELLSSAGSLNPQLLRRAVLAEDLLRIEGWAYMVQYNYSAYVKLGIWNPSREALAGMSKAYGFPDAEILLKGEMSESFLEKAQSFFGFREAAQNSKTLRYLVASSDLIRYLYQEYGSAKLRAFLTEQQSPTKALSKVYDLTPQELEKGWRKDVLER